MLNDVNFKKFVIISLSLLVAFNGSVVLDYFNLSSPLIRQIFGFIFLTFVPGYTILRILRVHKVDKTEALLYAIGLSIFYIMITGAVINFVYPLIGIEKPIKLVPLLITFDISYLLLLILAYFRDRKLWENKNIISINSKDILNPWLLSLSLLPFLAIFGAYIFNYCNTPILIILLFLIASFIPVLILYCNPKHYYSYIVWLLSLSILYVSSFGVSWNYIWGYDINLEYYLANLVLKNGYWDTTIYSNVNAMLSIVILNPVYSLLLGISPVIIYKAVYPFIFSFVPVALYKTYTNVIDERKSFFAVFFFISLYTFFTEMLALARQQIAELYLALIILLIFSKIERNNKYTLLLIFTFSLVVSHYGTTYLFLFSLLLAGVVFYVLYRNERTFLLRPEYIASFYIMVFLWYTLTSSSSPFNTIVRTGNIILANIYDLLDPYKSQGLYMIIKPLSGLRQFAKYYILATQAVIAVGIIWLILNFKKVRFNREFVALALVWFIFDVYGIALPYFSNALNATRLYQLTLFFISPFEVIGFFVIAGLLSKVKLFKLSDKITLRSLATFLTIYLIITSGTLFYIAKDMPYPAYFDKEISAPRWSNGEIMSGLWMKDYKNSKPIYGDNNAILLFLGLLGQPISPYNFRVDWNGNIIQPKLDKGGYIFLKEWNIKNKKIQALLPTIVDKEEIHIYDYRLYKFIFNSDKIYSSQCAEYYYLTSI